MDIADRFRIDIPVSQAGMGGGLAGAALAGAVAKAGGLGTLGLQPPQQLRASIDQVRAEAPGRAVAVNLLMPFVRREHVDVCIDAKVDVVVVAFGGDRDLVRQLRDAGIFVFTMVGTKDETLQAVSWDVDGLIAQGREAGGHLVGTKPALEFLPEALAQAGRRPVFLAGGIATADDTRTALDSGAAGVVAGTRFVMTHESRAHPEYQRRIIDARSTLETKLFGLSWPARHRVIPNEATRRWCRKDGRAKAVPMAVNTISTSLSRLSEHVEGLALRLQRPGLPLFTPMLPLAGMPDSAVDRAALYAGETALRIDRVTSAKQALDELNPDGVTSRRP